MRRTRLIAVLAGLMALAVLSADASAMLHPATGRFLQRDPLPQTNLNQRGSDELHPDGMNLYQYVTSNPTGRLDPLGLWGQAIHKELTYKLATKFARYLCADRVSEWADAPDHDYRRPGRAGVNDILAFWQISPALAWAKARVIAEWHFPANPNGWVDPGGRVAWAKVDGGIERCDIKDFSEGLHVLQDSWSHQGLPYVAGIGHYRGAEWVQDETGAHWERTDGTLSAALSESADDTRMWREDVRKTGLATFRALVRSSTKCKCHCPHRSLPFVNGGSYPTVLGPPAKEEEVVQFLLREFPGDNAVRRR